MPRTAVVGYLVSWFPRYLSALPDFDNPSDGDKFSSATTVFLPKYKLTTYRRGEAEL